MRSFKLMLYLVAMLGGMAIVSVHGNEGRTSSHGGPSSREEKDSLREGLPNREDTTMDLDPTDILNYDPVTRTMRNRKVKDDRIDMTLVEECRTDLIQCRQNLADFHEKTLIDAMYDRSEAHDKVGSCMKELKACQDDVADCKLGCQTTTVPAPPDDSMESPCKLEQMFFRRFAKRFITMLILESEEEDESPLAAEVRVELSHYSWNKLRQFVQQKGKIKLVDAHDLMVEMLISARHDNETGSGSWVERITGMDWANMKVVLLLCALSIVLVMFEWRTHTSWWQQLCAVMTIMFFVSLGWNWIYLYKKEVARQHSELQKHENDIPANCRPGKMTWLDVMKEVFRRQMTFQNDPCDEYHERYLVDPIYEVPPTRALSHTISTMLMEPLKHLGKSLADFHRELLKDLPYQAWIPALLAPYLILAVTILILCYCPRRGQRRDDAAWERVRVLEDQLRQRDATEQRRARMEELEKPRRDVYAAVPQAPVPALHSVRDDRPLWDVPPGWHQRQIRSEYPGDPFVDERPQARARRRQRGSSESDLLQQRQQRQPFVRDLGARGAQSAPYHGDVSGGDNSSDETDDHRGQRPRALHLEGVPRTSGQVSPLRVGASRKAPDKARPKTSDIQGQPIESPNSEIDSMLGKADVRKTVKAKGEVPVRTDGSRGQKVRDSQKEPRQDKARQGEATKTRAGTGGAGLEDEAKVRKTKTKSEEAPEPASTPLTPASSTDSEPQVTSAQGCDSPSSVSVIEGDSSPGSGGSVDGESHLQGLGMSLSGSIDIIEPLDALGGEMEEAPDSDEFEVLSREQCQTENMQ